MAGNGSGKKKASRWERRAGDFFPLPMRPVGTDEFDPPPATAEQAQARLVLADLAERYGKPHGLTRRQFLRTASGMAAAFVAMNTVYGPHYLVDQAEAADPEKAEDRLKSLAGQFIFDNQLHFVHEEFKRSAILDIRERAKRYNPALRGEKRDMANVQFQAFLREVYLESDTAIGLLSNASADKPENWFLSNDKLAGARAIVNGLAGGKRMLAHASIAPGHPGWLEEIDRAASELKPDSWKGYTVGDPLADSRYPYRLDDEKLMYPAYEKFMKTGIRNVCVHKGLLPADYVKSYPNWRYGMPDDVAKAAKDWPGLNFIIYHSAIKLSNDYPADFLERFEQTGRIDWVTDLAEIPAKHGVNNVYGELGSCFANSVISHPRIAAALVGTLVAGLGEDRVLWGTDSVWYGSPQWQIEAFRRLEMPEDLQKRFGWPNLGGLDSRLKRKIFGENGAQLYRLRPPEPTSDFAAKDRLRELRALPVEEREVALRELLRGLA